MWEIYVTGEAYRAELLIRPQPLSRVFRVAVNGGCNLARKCVGVADYVAEEIQMTLPNSAVVTASWTPRVRSDGSTFPATFAEYAELGGDFIRFDNAHEREILHMDVNYHGQTGKHDEQISLTDLQIVNRRRVALLRLMQTLEPLNWRIPVWFYMPWCVWWSEYRDFPEELRRRKPLGIMMSNVCEAVLAYLSFNPDSSKAFLNPTGLAKVTMESINEAIDHVMHVFSKTGMFEFRQIVFGRITVIPFPMYAPPKARLEGPNELLKKMLANASET